MASSTEIPISVQKRDQRNAVLAGFLGWTFDAFDFFVLTFLIADIGKALFLLIVCRYTVRDMLFGSAWRCAVVFVLHACSRSP